MSERLPYRRGERVVILPQYQDPGDDRFEWQTMDDEEIGRVTISPINTGLEIVPTQVVNVNMISRLPQK